MAAPVGGDYVPPVMAGDGRGPYPMMSNAKFNPTMAVIIIVLIGGCFMAGFISVFVRKCMTASSAGASIAAATSQGWSGKTRGLDKAAVDALPIVHSADLDEKDDRECPVCLTEFESEDSLRLLPACKHVFHQECIDAWFDAHSTCPLCRASLTGAGDAKDASPPVAQPVETVVEVSENGSESDNDVRARFEAETRTEVAAAPSAGTVSQQEDELRISAAGYPISREDELNSARGMLSRNSQSFKRAARGTTALEKAASFGAPGAAPGTSKPPTVPKPSLTPASMGIRRTSTDLVALRNLLTGDVNSGYRLNRSRSGAAASTSWFARAQSMEPDGPRSKENWSQIDLESGKPSTSKPVDGDDRSWSDRWSLASLRGAVFPLSRSTSDTSSVKSWS